MSAKTPRGPRCPVCYWALYDGAWCQGPAWCTNRGMRVDNPVHLTNKEALKKIEKRNAGGNKLPKCEKCGQEFRDEPGKEGKFIWCLDCREHQGDIARRQSGANLVERFKNKVHLSSRLITGFCFLAGYPEGETYEDE